MIIIPKFLTLLNFLSLLKISIYKIELGVVLNELDEVGFSELEVDEKTLDYQYVILCTK